MTITGITFVFTFYMLYISIVRSLYFRIFSASFLITFLSPDIATSINTHVPFSLSRIIMSGLLFCQFVFVGSKIWLPCLLHLFLLILLLLLLLLLLFSTGMCCCKLPEPMNSTVYYRHSPGQETEVLLRSFTKFKFIRLLQSIQ